MTRIFYPGDLADALQSSKFDRAREYLSGGADPDDSNDRGNTALMWAIKSKDRDMVALLLEAGADVNKVNDNGATPLMWAAAEGDPVVVQWLLDRGANLDATNKKNETAVTWAVEWVNHYNRAPQALELLLFSGAAFDEDLSRARTAAAQEPPQDVDSEDLAAAGAAADALDAIANGMKSVQILEQAWINAQERKSHTHAAQHRVNLSAAAPRVKWKMR